MHIFSQFVGCLFVLFMVSFAAQKLVSLIRFHLFIFSFLSFILRDWLKKILLQFMSESILPMLSSSSFMVLYLTSKPLSHFVLTFVYGVREWSKFIWLTCSCPTFPTPLAEEIISIIYSCLLCWRLFDCRCVLLSLSFLFCSFYLYVCFCTNTTLFWLL